MQTKVTADAILKDYYVGKIQNQLNNECFLLQTYEEMSVEWNGRKAVVPVHISRNSGTGWRNENEDLPVAGLQGYQDLQITAKHFYGRFGFTGQAVEFSDDDKGAFIPVFSSEMKRVQEDVRNDIDKATFTGGEYVGLIWQQKNEVGVAAWQYSGRPSNAVDVNYGIEVGGLNSVDIIRLDTYAVLAANVLVSACTATSITLGALDTTATPDGTVFAVKHNNANRTREMVGVLGNLCDPTHYTVDRTTATNTATALQANFLVADFTAAAPVYTDLTLDAIQILMDRILDRSNGSCDYMVINAVHRQSYTTLLQGTAGGVPANLRMDVDGGAKKKGDAGLLQLGYCDVPFRTAQHCPKGQIHLQTKSSWAIMQKSKGDFARINGQILRPVPNRDSSEGYWKQYFNLLCQRPNAQGVLAGVSFFGI